MHESLLGQGFSLLVYGMGIVFFFLALLVLITQVMSAIISKFFPEAPAPERVVNRLSTAAGDREPVAIEPSVLEAITAAIALHRAKRHAR